MTLTTVTAAGEVIIAGTNKRRGVELYDLQGRKLAALDSGRVNNVDGVFDRQLTRSALPAATHIGAGRLFSDYRTCSVDAGDLL